MNPPVLKLHEREKRYRITDLTAERIFQLGIGIGDEVVLADVPGHYRGYHPDPLYVTVCPVGTDERIGVKRSQIEAVG